MTRLDNSQFLKQVETLTQSNNGKSSIYLTQKRLSPSLSSITTTTTAEDESINDLPTNVITPTRKLPPPPPLQPPLQLIMIRNILY